MKTKIRMADHLPFHEIEKRYRKATDGMARGHWQVIWLIAQGTPAQHVADMTGYSYTWVRTLVQRYNQDGPDALDDGRYVNAGGQCILSAQQQQQLQEALEHDPPDRG
jgi:transposase